jgi:hypothetical protein
MRQVPHLFQTLPLHELYPDPVFTAGGRLPGVLQQMEPMVLTPVSDRTGYINNATFVFTLRRAAIIFSNWFLRCSAWFILLNRRWDCFATCGIPLVLQDVRTGRQTHKSVSTNSLGW